MSKERAAEIVAEVQAKGYVWDCTDQGRWAHANGVRREDNPHKVNYPGFYHINQHDWERDWERGWDQEETVARLTRERDEERANAIKNSSASFRAS